VGQVCKREPQLIRLTLLAQYRDTEMNMYQVPSWEGWLDGKGRRDRRRGIEWRGEKEQEPAVGGLWNYPTILELWDNTPWLSLHSLSCI
jgi:hypothetical protein